MSAYPDVPAYLNAIGTATPPHDIHHAFIDWAGARVAADDARLFARMARRSGIDHRWSVLPKTAEGLSPVSSGGFYAEAMPGTAARMALYAEAAPALSLDASPPSPPAPT